MSETKPRTKEAAGLLIPPTHQGPIDWFVFIDLISGAIKVLASGCAPTPQQAVRYINWRPWVDPWGNRLARHRAEMKRVLASRWVGDRAGLDDVQQRVIDAIDRGKVTERMLIDLYAENVER